MNHSKALTKDKVIGYIVVLLTLLLSYFFLIRPAQGQEAELIAQTQTNQQKLAQLKDQQQTLRQEEQLIALEQSEAELLSQRFPPRADATTVTAIVESVAAQSGVTVTQISVESPKAITEENKDQNATPNPTATPSPTPTPSATASGAAGSSGQGGNPALGGEIYEVGISITITGTPAQAGVFVQNLETAERTIYTRAITSSAASQSDGTPGGVTSQTIGAFTFLLPPLNVTPPPPVSQ